MPAGTSGTAGRPLVGILFVVLATLTFALSDVVTKHLAMLYPVPVVVAVRSAFSPPGWAGWFSTMFPRAGALSAWQW
jgi:hypothetical protein